MVHLAGHEKEAKIASFSVKGRYNAEWIEII